MDARTGVLKKKMKKIFFLLSIIIFCNISVFSLSPEEEYDYLYKDIRNVSTFGYKCTLEDSGKSEGIPVFNQGAFQRTSTTTDFAVMGKVFFKVLDESGNAFYTRYGHLNFTNDFRLVILCNDKKYYLPVKSLQESFLLEELRIYRNGKIESKYMKKNNIIETEELGNIQLYEITDENIASYDGFVIQTKKEPKKITEEEFGEFYQGFLEQSNVFLPSTLIRMLFLLEQMDDSQIKCKETKKYIIKYLMETDFQENFRKGLENELYTLNELDRYTFFLERNYN